MHISLSTAAHYNDEHHNLALSQWINPNAMHSPRIFRLEIDLDTTQATVVETRKFDPDNDNSKSLGLSSRPTL
jgi:hypothetical protein